MKLAHVFHAEKRLYVFRVEKRAPPIWKTYDIERNWVAFRIFQIAYHEAALQRGKNYKLAGVLQHLVCGYGIGSRKVFRALFPVGNPFCFREKKQTS